jgi:hypothetical protein
MTESLPAPPGTIWVCGACGKTSRVRWEFTGQGWDESCMMNAILCKEEKTPEGCWVAVPEQPR